MSFIRCRLCSWKIAAWYTTKGGKRRSGYHRLIEHFEAEHSDEFDALMARLDWEFENKGERGTEWIKFGGT